MKREKDELGRWIPRKKKRTEDDVLTGHQKELQISQPWLDLYKQIKGVRCSPTEDFRQFKAWVGVVPVVAEMIFIKYSHEFFLTKRKYLALLLNFLKNMPSQENGAADFGMTRPTYRKHLWRTLDYLYLEMKEVQELKKI
jgi:hypothetical protein